MVKSCVDWMARVDSRQAIVNRDINEQWLSRFASLNAAEKKNSHQRHAFVRASPVGKVVTAPVNAAELVTSTRLPGSPSPD